MALPNARLASDTPTETAARRRPSSAPLLAAYQSIWPRSRLCRQQGGRGKGGLSSGTGCLMHHNGKACGVIERGVGGAGGLPRSPPRSTTLLPRYPLCLSARCMGNIIKKHQHSLMACLARDPCFYAYMHTLHRGDFCLTCLWVALSPLHSEMPWQLIFDVPSGDGSHGACLHAGYTSNIVMCANFSTLNCALSACI